MTGVTQQVGIHYNQWLATVLQAFGVPASEWKGQHSPSFGHIRITSESPSLAKHYGGGFTIDRVTLCRC